MKKTVAKIEANQERGARKAILEDLFVDFNRSRGTVYRMNFLRGLFFGLGSALGGTVVVALLIWLLSQVVDVFPALADFLNRLIETMEQGRS